MIIPVILSVACLSVAILFISNELGGRMLKAAVLKGCASLMFVCLGAWALSGHSSSFGVLVMVGLVLGMVGDVLLNMRFLYTGSASNKVFAVGILAFLSGHFLYIAALIGRSTAILLPAVVTCAVLSVISVPQLIKHVTAPSRGLKIFGYVYLVIVIAMFSLAACLLVTGGVCPLHLLFFAGALLFVVSDFIMIYYSFGKKLKLLRVANLLLYYVAQLLIALTILSAA